jgi:hypothetical protein
MGNYKKSTARTLPGRRRGKTIEYRPYARYDGKGYRHEAFATPSSKGRGRLDERVDVIKRTKHRTVKKTVQRTVNANSLLSEKLSRLVNPKYGAKTVYKDGKLKKKVKRGRMAGGRSVKRY